MSNACQIVSVLLIGLLLLLPHEAGPARAQEAAKTWKILEELSADARVAAQEKARQVVFEVEGNGKK